MKRKNIYKMVFLGESTVGKTSISTRFVFKRFSEFTDHTIGAAYNCISTGDIGFDIWDTAGQERFDSLMELYYRDANIILLVFDISNPYTVKKLHHYIKKINDFYKQDYKCVIVGNKKDLVSEEELKRIDKDIRKQFDQYDLDFRYRYVSAKTNDNINSLLDDIVLLCSDIELDDEESDKEILDLNTNKTKYWYSGLTSTLYSYTRYC